MIGAVTELRRCASMFPSWTGFREEYRIEKWREAAVILRRENPERYERIVAGAPPEIAEAVQKDPDAFVALFLASANDAGVLEGMSSGDV